MVFSPSKSEFIANYNQGKNTVLYERLSADLDTPVLLMMKLVKEKRNSFMLESVTGGDTRGRYSVIGMQPDLIWRSYDARVEINRQACVDPNAFEIHQSDPLKSLRTLLDQSAIDLCDDLPPMAAGLFGFLGYDMIRHVEYLPDVNPDTLKIPDAVMLRPSIIAIIDGVKDELTIVTPVWFDPDIEPHIAYNDAKLRIKDTINSLDSFNPRHNISDVALQNKVGEAIPNVTKSDYFDIVEKAKNYIKSGDIFQVVPSQRWTLDYPYSSFAFYRALRQTNPSPYMFYFDFGDFQVVGASPEILVRVKDNIVTIRPIAGTRPRGASEAEDTILEQDLLNDNKELAEHLMLLDLGRNDVGRVAKIGTVRPTDKFIIERYSHVMHIVSNVVGELSNDHDALSALLAGLPAGTVSGAPKVRAMEIIDELEVEKRGVYGGGVGYFSSGGSMDICIALRTAVIKDEKLYAQAGGGIVYDSDPEAEFQETVNKSKALITAANRAYLFEMKTPNR